MQHDTATPEVRLSAVLATLLLALDTEVHTAASRRDLVTTTDHGADYAILIVRTRDDEADDRAGILIRHEHALDMLEVRPVDGWLEPYGDPLLVDVDAMRQAGAIELPDDACDQLATWALAALEYVERSAAERERADT